jgi:putative flippase GtrA
MYQRFQQLIHEFAKFGVIGVIGLLITNFGVGLLHFDMGVGPTTSTTAATVVAMAVTYVGNRYWSFRHRERTNIPRETVIFIVLNVIGLLIQDAATWVNYYGFGYHDKFSVFVALNFGIAVATVFRFWSYRKFVWAPSSPSGGGEAGDGAVPAGPAPAAPGMARVGSGAQAGYANGNGGAPNGAETNGAAAGPDGAAGANGHLVSGGATHSGQSLN